MKKLNLINNLEELEENLSKPSQRVIDTMADIKGNILILGASGKIGPTLTRMIKKAVGESKKVIGVAKFSDETIRKKLEKYRIETIKCNLLDRENFDKLPDAENIIYLVGMKFGSVNNEPLTWAVNTGLPSLVIDKYRHSKIIVLSTGNIYPFVSVKSRGSIETDTPEPVGEYAQSCFGRERICQYFSEKYKTPMTIIRLNYAVELRYGVLFDIAMKVKKGIPIDLSTGYVNVIWQTDANRGILLSFQACSSSPEILNLTGPDIISIKKIAIRFGEIFNKQVIFKNIEEETCLLSNAKKFFDLFGYPETTLETMITSIAHWIKIGGQSYNKPTYFEKRNGKF
ncbi:MAG: NAD-dependent epimerase/dehydratase family protein [Candidatus Omnitrophica bacterium]|nr:NAD-dependent epimerase/dehydratase family protein [Candidatus Omnitrophota bacterium]